MPRGPSRKPPSYRHHAASGQAVVTLSGQDFYLGPYGSKASRAEYDRLVAEWLANGRRLARRQSDLTVNELLLAYWKFADKHYVTDGKPSEYLANMRYALKPVRTLYGHTMAADFDSEAMESVRQSMIDSKTLCRNTINDRIGKIRSVFRWATTKKLIPLTVLTELCSVKGLEKNRAGVRQTKKVKPLPDEYVTAVLPFVSAPVRAMVQLQHLTGMRPGEVVIMRGVDIDRSGEVWAYTPSRHKCENADMDRVIFLGPKAQAILTPWLSDDPMACLFRPPGPGPAAAGA